MIQKIAATQRCGQVTASISYISHDIVAYTSAFKCRCLRSEIPCTAVYTEMTLWQIERLFGPTILFPRHNLYDCFYQRNVSRLPFNILAKGGAKVLLSGTT